MTNEELRLMGPVRETIPVSVCCVILGMKQSPKAKLEQSTPLEENSGYFKICGKICKDADSLENFKKL